MKTFKWLLIVVVVMSFAVGMSYHQAFSAKASKTQEKQQKAVKKSPIKAVKLYTCPFGWHKTQSLSKGGFICMPNKPQPVACPEGTKWGDDLYTQHTSGSGLAQGVCYGCTVGCYPEIGPPK